MLARVLTGVKVPRSSPTYSRVGPAVEREQVLWDTVRPVFWCDDSFRPGVRSLVAGALSTWERALSTWKQLYVESMGHQGALRDVAHRIVLAAQAANSPELTRRLNAERTVPIYILCAMLDTLGVEVNEGPTKLTTVH